MSKSPADQRIKLLLKIKFVNIKHIKDISIRFLAFPNNTVKWFKSFIIIFVNAHKSSAFFSCIFLTFILSC